MQIKKRRYIQFALALMAFAIIGGTMLVNSPRVQQRVSVLLATELENRIGTRVNLGGVHWLFPSDIVIDSLRIDDQEGEHLLSVNRIAAKVEWMPLIKHRQLSVRNIRLFHPDINIYRVHTEEGYNYQFLIDAFASKKERKEPSKLSLRINTLLIRQGKLRVESGKWKDKNDHPDGNNFQLSPFNIQLDNLAAQMSLKTLSADSISLITRHLGFKEQSGLQVDGLYFRLVGNHQGATLANFRLDLPHSTLQLDTIWAAYANKIENTDNGNPKDMQPEANSQFSILNSQVIIKGRTLPSHITPADLSFVVPQLRGVTEKVHLAADFIGSPQRINLKALDIHTDQGDAVIKAKGTAQFDQPSNTSIKIDLQEATLTTRVWRLLANDAPEIYKLIPKELIRTGNISSKGMLQLEDGHTGLDLQAITDAGNLKAHLAIDPKGRYTANLEGKALNVAQVIPTSPLAKTNLDMDAKGSLTSLPFGGSMHSSDGINDEQVNRNHQKGINLQSSTFNLKLDKTQLLDYEYKHIDINGEYDTDTIGFILTLDDPNGKLTLEAGCNSTESEPHYTVELKADSLDLHAMQFIDIHEGNTFSAQLDGDIRGHDIDHMTGSLKAHHLAMHREGDDYTINNIALYATDPDTKALSLHADFMTASVKGDFTYRTLLGNLLGHLHYYLPSLCRSHVHNHTMAANKCYAKVDIYNTRPLQELLLIPLSISKTASIEAQFYDHQETFELWLDIPHLEYEGNVVKDIKLTCKPENEQLTFSLNGTLQNDPTTPVIANLKAYAHNDNIRLCASWRSINTGMFNGELNAQAHLDRDDKGDYTITVTSDSSHAAINYSEWTLEPFKFSIAPDRINVQNLHLANDNDQHLSIDGAIAHNVADTLQVNLSNIDLGYLLTLTGLKGISLDGNVSGHINAANLYTPTPYLNATLQAQDFTFCNGPIGNMQGTALWNQDSTRLEFTALLNETPRHTSVVDGFIDLNKSELRLDIAADSLNAAFLNSMLSGFMNDINGNATGNLTVEGPLNALDLNGTLMGDLTFNLTPTNVKYHLKDSIRFSPGIISLNNIEVFDKRGQKAIVTGNVTHDKLTNYAYDLHITPRNLLGIDFPDTGHDSFYTTIYGTGEVHVTGSPTTPLTVHIKDAHPEIGSLFALNLVSETESSSNAFITFTDRSAKRNVPTINTRPATPRRRTNAEATALNLDIEATITPDAELKLVMNQAADDHISARGNGDLRISIHGDDINLFGTYTVDRGAYRLSLQDVINKNFDVVKGSTVTFDGDPMNAELDITARYAVPSTPLKELSPEQTGSVRVNCLLHIGGTLNAPEITFDLELPQGTEEQKSILRNYTSTKEQMNLQFIYLLGLSKFYTPNMAQTTEETDNMGSFLSTTISGQINNILSNIISNDNWNFASNIRTDNMRTGENNDMTGDNWENMEIEGALEGRLLNNRLLINGNFGYRNNPMYASNFIGDLDARYLLTNDFSLKGYNKTNDRYFTKTARTTQGIGLLFQRDFERLFPARKKQSKPTLSNPIQPDSTTTR